MVGPEVAIVNVDVVNEGSRRRGYVTIDSDGLIAEVGVGEPSQELLTAAREVFDGKGGMLIPGIIDTHVHFREPGLTHKGSIQSESLKALSGGVTSIIDMPNCKPPTVDLESWQWKMDRAAATSAVNYAFYLGATADNLDLLVAADYSRVPAVKLFLGSSTGNMLLDSDDHLRRLLTEVPALIAVHAESESEIAAARQWAIDECKALGMSGVPIPMHSAIRSRRACVEGTRRIVDLAKKYNARLHVCHVSTAQELDFFTPGDVSEKKITAETSANYLTHTALDYPRLGASIKCNPSLKLPSDRDALRAAIAAGQIDTIGTDHAPHTPADKQGDALTAASGIASIDRSLGMLLALVEQGYFTIEQLVAALSHNPATIYRIHRRGFIRPGYHADLTLINPTFAETTAAAGDSPVAAVWLNGQIALNHGTLTPAPTQPLRFNP